MTLAYSYLRMSTAEQLKGDSLRRQLERSRAYAERHGLRLDETLQDLGISAHNGKHRKEGTALARFFSLVKGGGVPKGSYLIVENLDRLSREAPRKALQPFLDLIDAGIRIVTLSDEQVYDADRLDREPWGLMVSMLVMTRANEESKVKGERLGAAWKRKQETAAKIKVTARCPGWLRLSQDRQRFEIIPDKAAAVRRVFEMTAAGIGRQAATKMLNASGVKSPGGGRWYASSLARLLKSDAVLGTYQPYAVKNGIRTPRGEPLMGYYPQVVTPELVARARAAMGERSNGYAGRRGPRHTNLFPGLVYCGCGARMRIRHTGKRRKGGPAIICSRAAEGDPCEHRRQFPYDKFERAFLANVREIDVGSLDQQQSDAAAAIGEQLAAVTLALATKRKALRRWTEEFEADDGTKLSVVAERIRTLGGEIENLEEQERVSKQRLADATAKRASGEEQLAAIERLARRMVKAKGTELYGLRAALAQEIRRVIQRITFRHLTDDPSKHVAVVRVSPTLLYLIKPPNTLRGEFTVGRFPIPRAVESSL